MMTEYRSGDGGRKARQVKWWCRSRSQEASGVRREEMRGGGVDGFGGEDKCESFTCRGGRLKETHVGLLKC